MEIVLVSNGMPFGCDTIKHKTLGGSETACLMVAKELKKLGHVVNVFTPLPYPGEPDHMQSGEVGEDGVRYVSIENYAPFIGNTEVDLLIVLRDPRVIATTNQAKKRVLWMHDLATHRGMQSALDNMAWCFDEIWTVSEFHKRQVHQVTGYPESNIFAMRNGIVPVETNKVPFRLVKTLAYAARPERGLANLIKEGGIMEHLPDYKLKLSMYANYPDEMRPFYEWCRERIAQLPNVEMPDELRQIDMRQRLADVSAYIYPTQFEETSCILARECIEQGTPFITTRKGALPETLGDCGLFFEDWMKTLYENPEKIEEGSEQWCKHFAEFIRHLMKDGDEADEHGKVEKSQKNMAQRTDLYWDGVAKDMIARAEPEAISRFSRAWSLVQDGDVIPAYALLKEVEQYVVDWGCQKLRDEIEQFYPFILPETDPRYMTLADYYEFFYREKQHELQINQDGLDQGRGQTRYQHIKDAVAQLPFGSVVYEYGAGEGHVIVPLAQDFPNITFVAFDQVQSNVEHHSKYPNAPENLESIVAKTPEEALELIGGVQADAVICVEVLEHNVDPFATIDGVEAMCKEGGEVIITTPFGAWEPNTFATKASEYHLRNHIWHFDKTMIRDVFRGKEGMKLIAMVSGMMVWDGHSIGNYFYSYKADHKPVNRIDPLEKAYEARSRQSCAAAIIAYNNEDTILRLLNSIDRQVQIVQIAHGPSTDGTRKVIDEWAKTHPWHYVNVIDVPKIAAPQKYGGTAEEGDEFGFDDARNASVAGLEDIVDWVLWIDTDEYLAGNIGTYLRGNCMDGYLIPQHHFTVEPRGAQTQIDRPARLFRVGRGFKARGHIHEHFEVPDGGPGHCYMLHDVDIGHTGYVNEAKRRERFNRNFPFLRWDHEENPDRKLHPFLWFRDIVHRMRYCMIEGRQDEAAALAREAEDYYLAHSHLMASFGAGLPTALEYMAEIRKILQKGVPMRFTIEIEGQPASFSGTFLDIAEVHDIMDQVLSPEFKRRTSRYY